jgi:hypothetical protein
MMANKDMKHPDNIPGKFYCTDPDDDNGEGCIACNVCYNGAEEFFDKDLIHVTCLLFNFITTGKWRLL